MEQHKVIETEIIGLEQKFWDAMRNKDIKTMESLTDDTCIVAGPEGVMKINKSDLMQLMNQQPYQLNNFEFDGNWQVSVINDNLAVIGYKVKENMTVEGQPVSLEATDASTWIRRNGKWVCTLHTESISGDPFGRDRTAPLN